MQPNIHAISIPPHPPMRVGKEHLVNLFAGAIQGSDERIIVAVRNADDGSYLPFHIGLLTHNQKFSQN